MVSFGEVIHKVSYLRLEAVLLKFHAKLAPGWVLIPVNSDPIQRIGLKVEGKHSFESGHSFTRLWYIHHPNDYTNLALLVIRNVHCGTFKCLIKIPTSSGNVTWLSMFTRHLHLPYVPVIVVGRGG